MIPTTFLSELNRLDTEIFFFFNQLHNPFFDYFMYCFSNKYVWIPLYLSLAYLLKRNYNWSFTLLSIVGISLVILISDQAGASLIRPYVCRMRPANLNNEISDMVHIVNNYRGGSYGFPSCHASNSFGLAFFLVFLLRHRVLSVFFLGWAALTCYSRIYLGVHYPGDTLAGMLLGLGSAAVVYFALHRLYRRYSVEHSGRGLVHVYVPVVSGAVTVLLIMIYSGVMLWME